MAPLSFIMRYFRGKETREEEEEEEKMQEICNYIYIHNKLHLYTYNPSIYNVHHICKVSFLYADIKISISSYIDTYIYIHTHTHTTHLCMYDLH